MQFGSARLLPAVSRKIRKAAKAFQDAIVVFPEKQKKCGSCAKMGKLKQNIFEKNRILLYTKLYGQI